MKSHILSDWQKGQLDVTRLAFLDWRFITCIGSCYIFLNFDGWYSCIYFYNTDGMTTNFGACDFAEIVDMINKIEREDHD